MERVLQRLEELAKSKIVIEDEEYNTDCVDDYEYDDDEDFDWDEE